MQSTFKVAISLALGFSPVSVRGGNHSRFNGLFAFAKAVETARTTGLSRIIGLKPGANEIKICRDVFETIGDSA
jgi:hypothetical protein